MKKLVQLKVTWKPPFSAEGALNGIHTIPGYLSAYATDNVVFALFDIKIPENGKLPNGQKVVCVTNDEYNRLCSLNSNNFVLAI